MLEVNSELGAELVDATDGVGDAQPFARQQVFRQQMRLFVVPLLEPILQRVQL